MEKFNASLSTYDPQSTISRINNNDPKVKPDAYFTACFKRAQEISQKTGGAFDMTVAPLVNAYGFGFTSRDSIYPALIDSLLEITGFEKVKLDDDALIKEDPRIMLDASAIAKGFGVDVVANYLESKGVRDYLVEIGGELRCQGKNPRGTDWNVGIDRPLENLIERQIEAYISLSGAAMATSGNYRQFYEMDGVKYSHTVNPATGYPVDHSLLSVTVIANDCMTADAYATAFMVLGFEKSVVLTQEMESLESFLIYSGFEGELLTWASPGFEKFLR